MTSNPGITEIILNIPQPRASERTANAYGNSGKTIPTKTELNTTIPKLEYQRTDFECDNARLGKKNSHRVSKENMPKKKLNLTLVSKFGIKSIIFLFKNFKLYFKNLKSYDYREKNEIY